MSRRLARTLAQDRRGSTVVEFALVGPVVVLMVMAALELGMALRANAALRDLIGWAGREAVVSYQLVASGGQTKTQIEEAIRSRAASGGYKLGNGTLRPVVTIVRDTSLLTVNRVNIHLTYAYRISLPLVPDQTVNMDFDRTFYVPN